MDNFMTKKTGWPAGLLQDDDGRLSRWFASRPDARYVFKLNMEKNMKEDVKAFARAGNEWDNGQWTPAEHQEGMTLRDYFAAKAMQSLNSRKHYEDVPAHVLASDAYALADAMIYER